MRLGGIRVVPYRRERDLLGDKEVPNDVYYGIQTARAMDNFPITGYKPHRELVLALAYVKNAAALANMDVQRLNSKTCKAIVAACDEVLDGKLVDQFAVDFIEGCVGTS